MRLMSMLKTWRFVFMSWRRLSKELEYYKHQIEMHRGIENIERILEKLESDGFGVTESFETFGRASIHRLRRLLPDARWVNGVDLAEVEGGEVAITNLHSCNGPDFVLQLHLLENDASKSPGSKVYKANARLKCVYFPIVEGKENIERILEKLESDGFGVTENFETFGRVSIRRLGRLLPDARWFFAGYNLKLLESTNYIT